jgi:dihydropteroate synthase
VAPAADTRAAARYNVRPLLPGPEDALRQSVLRLGIPTSRLSVLAQHGAVEALAVQGMGSDQIRVLERIVRDGRGEVLSSSDGDRAVILAPLATAGELAGRLAEWSDRTAELGRAIGAALMARGAAPAPLVARGHRLPFGTRTILMGIANATPDSFSGDGMGRDVDSAVALARAMVEAGADIIDVGGESTRPNSTPVTAGEELARVIPVVEAISGRLDVAVSIDTRKAVVARAAIDAGAAIVNDVWGLRGDPDMAAAVGARDDIAVVAMHNQRGTEYGDLLEDICASLRESLAIAAAAGIAGERVIIDPGFGFAKTPAQNLELIRRFGELRGIGRAILVGPSRKSTIGVLTDATPPQQRKEGGIALATLAVAAGAHGVRTHDVAETARALRVVDAVVRGTPDHIRSLPMPGPTG